MFVKCLYFTERLRCAGAKGIYSHHYSALGDVLFVSTSGRYVRQAINQQVLFAAIRYASMPFTFILLSRFSTPQPKHCRDIPEILIKKIHAYSCSRQNVLWLQGFVSPGKFFLTLAGCFESACPQADTSLRLIERSTPSLSSNEEPVPLICPWLQTILHWEFEIGPADWGCFDRALKHCWEKQSSG